MIFLFNDFKVDILHTNYREIIKVLLNKKIIYQTIRFTLFEAFAITEQNLTFRFLIIYQQCLNLLNALLSYFEKSKNEQIDFHFVIIDDTSHEKFIIISYLQKFYIQSQFK